MTPHLCFVDCETTGLDPDRHEVWEVAIILEAIPDEDGKADAGLEGEYLWQLPVDLSRADPIALDIGRFHERRWRPNTLPREMHRGGVMGMEGWAQDFARLTWGAHMIGAVPSFDTERLARLLRRHGACPGWHYQPIDVETLAQGWLQGAGGGAEAAGDPPWDSEALSRAVGVDPGRFDRHSALGDARWARAIWRAVMGDAGSPPEPAAEAGAPESGPPDTPVVPSHEGGHLSREP